MLRIAWAAAMLAWPLAALLYLLFSIAIPHESHVVGELHIEGLGQDASPQERFTRISQLLVNRLLLRDQGHAIPSNFVSILLLIIGAILELSKVEGARFYFDHPVISVVLGDIARFGTGGFYVALAALFLIKWPGRSAAVSLEMPIADEFVLDRSARKMIGGAAAGVASVLRIDSAYIRVLFLLLNIVTFGIAGVVYLIILFFFRHKARGETQNRSRLTPNSVSLQESRDTSPRQEKNQTVFHFAMAFLFLALAAVRISNEFRLFFFNEPFIQGSAISFAGIAIALRGLSSAGVGNERGGSSISILAGSSVFFAGVSLLAIAIGRVAVTLDTNIEIAEIVAALSLSYFGIVFLNGGGRRMAFLFAVILGLCSACTAMHLPPIRDLAAVGQFFDFFYPVIFGVLALWIAFEK
jgi:phage shock protein PspC (stress-responsive transcriptional regulator)